MTTKITFLGTGASQGIPFIGCKCRVCNSTDPHDKRLRSSIIYERGDVRILIDAGPDLRYQLIRAGVREISGVVLTHEHKDHIGGIDELRALNYVDYPTIRRITIYGTERVLSTVRRHYDYAFEENRFQGVPDLELQTISPPAPFEVAGVTLQPIVGGHSSRFVVTGYRIGDFAYLTDFKTIADEEVERLMGVKTLVVNALKPQSNPSHFCTEEALALIERIKPQRSYLTHMSHDMGLHAEVNPQLPQGVQLAYDTLQIEI